MHPRIGWRSQTSCQYTIKRYSTILQPTQVYPCVYIQATFYILNMHRVLHHMRDRVVSGNTFAVPLNNLEHIDGMLA